MNHKTQIQICLDSETDFKKNINLVLTNIRNTDNQNQVRFLETLTQLIVDNVYVPPKKFYLYLLMAKMLELGTQNMKNYILDNEELLAKLVHEIITLWDQFKLTPPKKTPTPLEKIIQNHLRILLEMIAYMDKYHSKQAPKVKDIVTTLQAKSIRPPRTFIILERDIKTIDFMQLSESDLNKSNNSSMIVDQDKSISYDEDIDTTSYKQDNTNNNVRRIDLTKGKLTATSTATTTTSTSNMTPILTTTPKDNNIESILKKNLGVSSTSIPMDDDNVSVRSYRSIDIPKSPSGGGMGLTNNFTTIRGKSPNDPSLRSKSPTNALNDAFKKDTKNAIDDIFSNKKLVLKRNDSNMSQNVSQATINPDFDKEDNRNKQLDNFKDDLRNISQNNISQASILLENDKGDRRNNNNTRQLDLSKSNQRPKSPDISMAFDFNKFSQNPSKNPDESMSRTPRSRADISIDGNRSRSDFNQAMLTPKGLAKDLTEIERNLSRGRSPIKQADTSLIKDDPNKSIQGISRRAPGMNLDTSQTDIMDFTGKLEKQLKELKIQNEQYRQELDHYKRKFDPNKIEDLMGQIDRYQAQSTKLQQEVNQLKADYKKKCQDHDQTKNDNIVLRQQVDTLTKDLSKMDGYLREINNLKANNQSLQAENQQLITQLGSFNVITRENNDLKQRLRDLQENNTQFQSSMNDLKLQNQNLIAKVKELETLQTYNTGLTQEKNPIMGQLTNQPQQKLIVDPLNMKSGSIVGGIKNDNQKPTTAPNITKPQGVNPIEAGYNPIKPAYQPSINTYGGVQNMSMSLDVEELIERTKNNLLNDQYASNPYANLDPNANNNKIIRGDIAYSNPNVMQYQQQGNIIKPMEKPMNQGMINNQFLQGSKPNELPPYDKNRQVPKQLNTMKGYTVPNIYELLDEVKNRLQSRGLCNDLDEYRLNCLKSKALLYKNEPFQIGMTTSLFINENTDQLNVSLVLYYGNMGYESIENLNTKLIDIDRNITIEIENNADTSIMPTKQTKQVFTFGFENIPFIAPSLIGSYTYEDELIEFGLILPITINKFMDFRQTDVQDFKMKWDSRKPYIFKSEQIELNNEIIADIDDFNKYFNDLIDIPSKKYNQEKNIIRFGCLFELDIPNFEYLVKIVMIDTNNTVRFSIACSENTVEMGKFMIKTLVMLFGKAYQYMKNDQNKSKCFYNLSIPQCI